MERSMQKSERSLKDGTAVGSWIIQKSKSYPGHNYYFNTLTGETVWNLSTQELANAKRATDVCEFENHIEPKGKPPMLNFNKMKSLRQQKINTQYPTGNCVNQQWPIQNSVCIQNALLNPKNPLIPVDLITAQAQLNPRVWDLGMHQQILILPTVSDMNLSQQSLQVGYNMQQGCNIVDNRSSIYNDQGNYNRFRLKNNQNRYQATRCRPDLRKRICRNVGYNKNDGNSSKLNFNKRYADRPYFTHKECKREEYSYESELLEENEENCLSKLDCAPLRNLAKPTVRTECWYLVVDADVLLNNFNYLNNLVNKDFNCCLLVPQCVLEQLECYADNGKDVSARRVLRFLSDYARIGNKELEEDISPHIFKNIYNVCVNLGKQNFHVVLISDDKNLLLFKKVIQVFSMADVKHMVSIYVSHQQSSRQSPLMTDVAVRPNLNNYSSRTMNSNNVVPATSRITWQDTNNTRSCFQSETVDTKFELDNSTTESNKIPVQTDCMENNSHLTSNVGVQSVNRKIVNLDNRANITKDAKSNEIESINNIKEKLKPNEKSVPNIIQKVRHIKLNRKELHPLKNTTNTSANTIEIKKYRWRKRRDRSSEATVSATGTDPITESAENIDSCSETKPKNIENDENSSSIIIEKPTGDCHVIDEGSSFGIISNSGSNIDTISTLHFNQNTLKPRQSLRLTNNSLSLNNVMYEVTSRTVKDNLESRRDEWVSRFVQIMEDVLSQILRQESFISNVALPPPWNLLEAVQCIIKEFFNNCFIVDAANKLSIISNKICNKSVADVIPSEFMEMYSYGVYLVDALKQVQENNEDLQIASNSLNELLEDIENPQWQCNKNYMLLDEATQCEGETAVVPNSPERGSVHAEMESQCNTISKSNLRIVTTQSSEVEGTSQAGDKKVRQDVMITFKNSLTNGNSIDNEESDSEVPAGRSVNIDERIDRDEVDGASPRSDNLQTASPPKIIRCFTMVPKFEERLKYSNDASYDMESDIFTDREDYYHYESDAMNEDTAATDAFMGVMDLNAEQVELFYEGLFNDVKDILITARDFCKSYAMDMNETRPLSLNNTRERIVKKVHPELIKIRNLLDSLLNREQGTENAKYILKEAGIYVELPKQYTNTIEKLQHEANLISKAFEHILQI